MICQGCGSHPAMRGEEFCEDCATYQMDRMNYLKKHYIPDQGNRVRQAWADFVAAYKAGTGTPVQRAEDARIKLVVSGIPAKLAHDFPALLLREVGKLYTIVEYWGCIKDWDKEGQVRYAVR